MEFSNRPIPRGSLTMKRSNATRPEPASLDGKAKPTKKEGHRETVEAIVVAFILALLVRGFEAEAFVIPTGSMAPTLMGRHKEVTCPQCKFVYTVNASGEEGGQQSLGFGGLRIGQNSAPHFSARVNTGTCVNCRYTAKVADEPTFNGDRILVMKFPYDMPFLPGASDPERWDIVVFRYPEEPEMSYIKRLAGKPGETLRIWHGDIYIKKAGDSKFEIARKPLRHLNAMAMTVHDDRYRPASMWDKPEWLRWTSSKPEGWKEGDPGTYMIEAKGPDPTELRYRHLVPDPEQWDALLNQRELSQGPRPTLITDYYSYNTNQTSGTVMEDGGAMAHPHWVGDLLFSAKLEVKEARGVVRFELVEGGVPNRCELNLADGTVRLFRGKSELGSAKSPDLGVGSHDVLFTNFDDRLTVAIDGKPVFGNGLEYEESATTPPIPTDADLSPAAVAATDASVAVSDLVLKRDIYYTLNPGHADYDSLWNENDVPVNAVELFDNLSDPSTLAFLNDLPSKDYVIGEDRYLMLGDNSPWSRDSRGWNNLDRRDPTITDINEPGAGWETEERASWEVPRKLLTGKAFFIYWPHGKPFGPDIRLSRDFRIPFRPYVERMKWIR